VTVKELLGPASVQTTQRYAHPSRDHRRAAVDRLIRVVKIRRDKSEL